MRAYKLEILVIDYDEVDQGTGEEIKELIENQKFPNYCINPRVMAIQSADIGPWTDDHPLNKRDTSESEYRRIFSD